MSRLPEQEDQIRRYILGVAAPDEVEQVEIDLLRGGENLERLRLIEDELIADYALGALDERESELMEKNFFSTPERRERLMFAREMAQLASTYDTESWVDKLSRIARRMLKLLIASFQPGQIGRSGPIRWEVAFYATLLIGLGFGIWSAWHGNRESAADARVKRGMVALNQAYHERRLVKARITELQYSPFRETRGGTEAEGEPADIDLAARRRARNFMADEIAGKNTD